MDYQLGKSIEDILNNQGILNSKIDELLKRIPKPKEAAKDVKED